MTGAALLADDAPLDAILAAIHPRDPAPGVPGESGARWSIAIPSGWMQGRTAYGGIGAAVALAAARTLAPDAGPLRTAQLSFTGPLGGAAVASARMVRRSRRSAFIAVELVNSGASDVATCALLTFTAPRETLVSHDRLAMPDVPDPEALARVPPHPLRPAFTSQFDMRPINGPPPGPDNSEASHCFWVRFATPTSAPADVALLALGDALPPAAMRLFPLPGPVSSMNWTVQMLADDPRTDDGWWLLQSRSDHVANGFAMQHMTLWNRAGEPVMTGYQTVAIFV